MAKIDKDLQNQINILATNLEILNQKLIKNPEEILSPGEKALKEEVEEVSKKVDYLNNLIKSTEIWNSLKVEKEGLSEQIVKLGKVLKNLEKMDKSALDEFFEKLDVMNANSVEVNDSLKKLNTQAGNIFKAQKREILINVGRMLKRQKKDFNVMLMIFFALALVVFSAGVTISILLIN